MSVEIKSINGQTFKLGGVSYPKGSVKAIYKHTYVDPETGVVKAAAVPTVKFAFIDGADIDEQPRKYTEYVDGNGDPYADFDAFSMALATILAASTATDVSVLTVDGEEPDGSGNVVNILSADKAAVTQATSKTTTVVSNTRSTTITTVALSDAADASFSFTFTNSKISATSVVLATTDMNGGNGEAKVSVTPGAGSATVKVSNCGTAAFNSAIKIGLVVI